MFILLARDPMAPVLVNVWADLRRFAVEQGQKPSSDLAKVLEAKGCAEAMEIWRAKRRAPK
jgi:hypothetical protein